MARKIRCSLCCCLLLALVSWLSIPQPVLASSSSKPSPSTNAGASLSSKNSTLLNATAHSRIKIVETEIWDGSKWQPAQWMDASGENAVSSPEDTPLPPRASQWASGWKIVVGESKDGWKYTWKRPHQGNTRASLAPELSNQKTSAKNSAKRTADSDSTALTSSTETEDSLVGHEGPYFELPQWMQAVRDDFNFKGLGSHFTNRYFAQLLPESHFVSRLPSILIRLIEIRNSLLQWIRGRVQQPLVYWALLSVSFRLEFLQWLSRRISEQMVAAVLWVFWILFVRNLGMCFSLLSYPVTREWKQFAVIPEYLSHLWTRGGVEKPRYSRTVEERLGLSASWRISQGNGFEFRRSCWHSVAPTLTSLWEESFLGKLFLSNMEPPAWLLRHSATCGLSTAAPTPTSPYFSSNIILNLSGYYLKQRGAAARGETAKSRGRGIV